MAILCRFCTTLNKTANRNCIVYLVFNCFLSQFKCCLPHFKFISLISTKTLAPLTSYFTISSKPAQNLLIEAGFKLFILFKAAVLDNVENV